MRDGAGVVIARVEAEEEQAVLPGLIALLGDAVEGGASIGFLPPLSDEEARRYWGAVLEEVGRGAVCCWWRGM